MRIRTVNSLSVSAIGLGAMPMSMYEKPEVTEEQGLRTITAALDAGLTFIDTADAYTGSPRMGDNERLVAKALRQWGGDASTITVATKGGHTRQGEDWDVSGRPDYLKRAVEASLTALGVEAIDLYQHHRPDPAVDYADTVGALADLLDEGKIKRAGISNASPAQIRQANEILSGRLCSVQNQFAPDFVSSKPELDLCDELGIAFLPWSPLGGFQAAASLGGKDSAFITIAADHGVSPQQVCLAWHLAQSPVVIPIPGASRPETILDSIKSADLDLTADEVATLDKSVGL
jgi:aryl-alcohol dehydrogenase-like predicted oxidoreductase